MSLSCLPLFIYHGHTSLGQLPRETSLSNHWASQQPERILKTVMGSVSLATTTKPSLGFPELPELPCSSCENLLAPHPPPSLLLIQVSGPFVVVVCFQNMPGFYVFMVFTYDLPIAWTTLPQPFYVMSWLLLCSRLGLCVSFPEAFSNKFT